MMVTTLVTSHEEEERSRLATSHCLCPGMPSATSQCGEKSLPSGQCHALELSSLPICELNELVLFRGIQS